MAYTLADKPFARADSVLICDECKLVKHYEAGTLWGEILREVQQHKKENHEQQSRRS